MRRLAVLSSRMSPIDYRRRSLSVNTADDYIGDHEA